MEVKQFARDVLDTAAILFVIAYILSLINAADAARDNSKELFFPDYFVTYGWIVIVAYISWKVVHWKVDQTREKSKAEACAEAYLLGFVKGNLKGFEDGRKFGQASVQESKLPDHDGAANPEDDGPIVIGDFSTEVVARLPEVEKHAIEWIEAVARALREHDPVIETDEAAMQFCWNEARRIGVPTFLVSHIAKYAFTLASELNRQEIGKNE